MSGPEGSSRGESIVDARASTASTGEGTEGRSHAGLGRAARRGAVFGGLAQGGQQLLSLLATLVLARLLAPEDFGIVAAANSLLAMSTVLLGVGITASIVRRPTVPPEWLSTMMWSSLLLAAVVMVPFLLGAPLLAALFGLPEAAPYLFVLAFTIPLNMAASVPLAIMRRGLAFGRYWGVQVLAMTVYAVVQIVLAALGWGTWSIVVGQLAMATFQCVGALVAARWLPRLAFRGRYVREELSFTGGMLGTHVMNYGTKNADYWVIGNVLGAAALGAYYIAFVLPSILRVRITGVVSSVLFPVFAATQDDHLRTQRVYVECMRLQSGIGFPAMAGIAVLAEPIIGLFFGHRWDAAIEPLRWIALAALVEFVATTPSHVSIAHKRVAPVMTAQIVRLAVLVPALLVAASAFGTIESVAVAVLSATLAWGVAQQVLVARPLALYMRLFARDLSTIVAATALMSGAVVIVDMWLSDQHAAVRVAVGVATGAAVYVLVGLLVARGTFGPLGAQVWALLASRNVRRGRG